MSLRIPPLGRQGDHVLHLLSDYIDGCLSTRATRAVEAHLAVCPACERELEEWRSLLLLVSRHATVHCPVDCADVVLQRLAEGGQSAAGRARRIDTEASLPPSLGSLPFALRSLPSSPVMWAAMAVLLVALAGGWTWQQKLGSSRVTGSVATGNMAPHLPPAPAMHGEAPARLDGAFGRSDSLILASDFAAEE